MWSGLTGTARDLVFLMFLCVAGVAAYRIADVIERDVLLPYLRSRKGIRNR